MFGFAPTGFMAVGCGLLGGGISAASFNTAKSPSELLRNVSDLYLWCSANRMHSRMEALILGKSGSKKDPRSESAG